LFAGSNLEKVLANGHFAITGELGPMRGTDLGPCLEHAEHMRNHVDAFNITDNQTAVVRIASMATAIKLVERGMDPVMQMTVRDRNRICLQADVLGGASCGVKNFLCIQGDHQTLGSEPQAKGVYDVDSTQLMKVIKDMRDENKFVSGDEMEAPLEAFIGGVVNPFADPFEYRPARFAKKIAAGVNFVQTQCIYDMDRLKEYMKRVVDMGLHEKCYILAGITPLKAIGAAMYMKNNVAGIIIPDEIVKRLKGAKEKPGGVKAEGLKLCVEQIQQVKEIEGIHGAHIMAIAWEEKVPEIVEAVGGLMPRPKFDD